MSPIACSTPFCFSDKLFPFTGAPMGSAGPALPSLTNAQKLALPSDTAVGTQVAVSDGFVVSGGGSELANGTWVANGTSSDKPEYTKIDGGNNDFIIWNGSQWKLNAGSYGNYQYVSDDDTSFPWEATWIVNPDGVGIAPAPTLTHPAIQQLAAPSTAQGAVFVSGGTQDGIYPIWTEAGMGNGKQQFLLLGSDNSPLAANWDGSHWNIRNSDFDPVYYSLSDVATPDLASNWKNASDGSAASITVTSISAGELYAGLAITNDGVTNGSSYVSQPFHGRQYYMGLNGGGSNNMHWDTTYNVWTDDVGEWTADNVAFPWQGADAHSSHSGATFSRNDVAAEANWENV